MLNSSLVALPPNRRALKRSASTASLPSPPRTHRKHARGRSRGSCDSDSDDNIALSSDEEEQEHRHKKRRTGETAAADEEAFWLGGAPQATTSSKNDAGSSTSTSKAQAAPLLYRKRAAQSQRTDVAPMSPPPSHRKTTTVTPKFSGATASPPRTPQTRSSTKRARALRDSPDNPFLATPVEDSDTPGLSASSANPSPSTPSYDKPTISLVFRGTRRTYQNPHYNHAEGRPLSPTPESKLPIEHPDYSPSLFCPPKLLFADARGKKGKKAATAKATSRSKARVRSPSFSSDEGEAAAIRPMKLTFGIGQTLDQELKTAGEPFAS